MSVQLYVTRTNRDATIVRELEWRCLPISATLVAIELENPISDLFIQLRNESGEWLFAVKDPCGIFISNTGNISNNSLAIRDIAYMPSHQYIDYEIAFGIMLNTFIPIDEDIIGDWAMVLEFEFY